MQMVEIDKKAGKFLVDQVYEAILSQIINGNWRPGTRLPSIRKLGKFNNISAITITNAYNRLVAEAKVEAICAKGFYVAEPCAKKSFSSNKRQKMQVDSQWLIQRIYHQDYSTNIPAGAGWLPNDFLYTEGIKHALSTISKRSSSSFASYGNPLGYLPLRKQIQAMLNQQGIEASEEQIVLTHGASQAIDLVFRSLLTAGDVIFVDDPGYSNFFPQLLAMEVKVVGVPRTPEGPNIEKLEALLQIHKPVAFFTSSTLQNPTGSCSSAATLHRILQLAEKRNFFIIEDEIFSELKAQRSLSMAELDQLRRVIYIHSFSKTISPSLRVGFMAIPEGLVEKIILRKMSSSLTSSTLSEQVVYQVLVDGNYRGHLSQLRDKLRVCQDRVANKLSEAGITLFHRPMGGMFIWGSFARTINAKLLTEAALKNGILLAPGQLFSLSQSQTSWFRFNVTFCDGEVFEKFIHNINNYPTHEGTLEKSHGWWSEFHRE